MTTHDHHEDFDFVVVGSGAGGGPLAANLALAGHRVLLLEAGDDHACVYYDAPIFHAQASEDAHMRWDYFVRHFTDEAQPQLLEDEGLEPWNIREIWLINGREPNHFVDITDTFDRKIAALRAHTSQIADPNSLVDRMRERMASNRAAAGLPRGARRGGLPGRCEQVVEAITRPRAHPQRATPSAAR